jgi:hypothetical protein
MKEKGRCSSHDIVQAIRGYSIVKLSVTLDGEASWMAIPSHAVASFFTSNPNRIVDWQVVDNLLYIS